ncbi:MAG: UDP-N-acetylglucosamine diphosphorylase/glucosamine-1-phosphate N-acetyltransferase [Nitrospirae bacterium GWF2_44_13]|nr:MAG: UDP-N-acetylglucosamine diphosphorylase/glucosamine-1-phosphate N-acetyltransferase [Nitrospirae bacterium GWF2_44_13]OGW35100.1 MAG: UDP-N-acetylglucosamine diphosphorylase/glucosamine-1-phosphate N-acetyltransferase [Nitrospirae bacterium GWD2_44_7]OGW65582.1 MAG: UDP-N-acetylglucosamine diphosphorylase/glucosamine-1-phosphate N-acetyltransferase [Nitrospirae bacterium RIFOXYA2_FULL_44_9]OGW74171.1 MAG: UDP-N-acetylglucosamine diphosphorylase/glucosamine-1-phosphate N-acetyltransferase
MKLAVVILAAGRGERMGSPLPKVLHGIFDKPMLQCVIDSAERLRPLRIVAVVGKHFKEIKKSIKPGNILFAVQKKPNGTGDALLRAKTLLKDFRGTILVLNGDVPLITSETLKKFLSLHQTGRNHISLISFAATNPASYGRILRDRNSCINAIVEDKDATEAQRKITEVNSGVYAIESGVLSLLKEIPLNIAKGEYYLTDIIGIAGNKGYKMNACCIGSEDEMMGVNTASELMKARKIFRERLANAWIKKGVTFLDHDSIFISGNVVIGKNTIIYPDVCLEGRTEIGSGCTIYPNVRIVDSVIKDGVVVKDSTVIEGSIVRAKAVVGPFAHIRPGCDIGSETKIGNFVEIKKSLIGDRTKASHLSYLGDASIGKGVNIGAGTITCNYDGKKKSRTTIEDGAFIGSDTQLVAPVRVGKGAYIGAGSTITKCVPAMSLSVSRADQKNIEGWAIKRQFKVQNSKFKINKKKRK